VNRYCVFAAVIAAASLVSCATADPQTADPQHAAQTRDKTYTTGSRIPVRDGSGSAYVNSVDNKEGVGDIMQKKDVYMPPKGGPN